MKALSIKQPWAWAIIHGGKEVENRSWSTRFRGPLIIHTGKTIDHEGYKWIAQNENRLACFLPQIHELQTGGIIGRANLVGCVRNHVSRWFFGPWGLVFSDPEPLEFVPYRGQLSFFEIDQDHIKTPKGSVPVQQSMF